MAGASDCFLNSLPKGYCGDHLQPQLPNETVLENGVSVEANARSALCRSQILTYDPVRSGFCAPCDLQLVILATPFNRLLIGEC
jgi:hypothetical protein